MLPVLGTVAAPSPHASNYPHFLGSGLPPRPSCKAADLHIRLQNCTLIFTRPRLRPENLDIRISIQVTLPPVRGTLLVRQELMSTTSLWSTTNKTKYNPTKFQWCLLGLFKKHRCEVTYRGVGEPKAAPLELHKVPQFHYPSIYCRPSMARCIDCRTTHTAGWEAEEGDVGISDGESKGQSPAPPPMGEGEQSLGKSCKSTELLSW